jgi:hypothetical protein
MKQLILLSLTFLLSLASFGIELPGNKDSLSLSANRASLDRKGNTSDNPLNLVLRDGRLKITLADDFNSGKIFLFDLLGNKILEASANENIDWSLAGLKSGVYFVVLKDAKASFTKKFLFKQEG